MTAILDNTECAFHLLPKDQSLLSLRWMFTIEGSPHYDVINVYRRCGSKDFIFLVMPVLGIVMPVFSNIFSVKTFILLGSENKPDWVSIYIVLKIKMFVICLCRAQLSTSKKDS